MHSNDWFGLSSEILEQMASRSSGSSSSHMRNTREFAPSAGLIDIYAFSQRAQMLSTFL